jgi:uncharacterized protein YjdB
MLRSARFLPVRIIQGALVLLGSLLLGPCSEGKDPAGLLEEAHILLTMDPAGLAELAPEGVRPIERIRLAAEEVPTGALLGRSTFEVDPQAPGWILDFSLTIPAGSSVGATLSVELLSLTTGSELVEGSGRVGPLTLQVGVSTEVRNVPLVRGPLANLSVTGVAIQEPGPTLREGQNAQITATAATTTPDDPPTIFWGSFNPDVASVSGTGLVQAVLPGLARIVARAGAAADTVTVTVLPRPASVILNPEGTVLDALGADAVFQATILDPRGQPVPEDTVTWAVGDLEILQNLENGRFRSLSRGTTTVRAGSTIDPDVFGSAEVVVRQVVTAVDVIPEEAVVFIGEVAEFQAVALDANENPIEGMDFSWSTPDPGLASVDENGLATGIEDGTASILAEAVSGVMGGVGVGSLAPTPGTTGVAALVVLPEVARVAVLPNPFTFRSLGQAQAFTARAYGLDEAGEPTKLLPLTDFTWSSLNEAVMRIDGVGLTADTAFVRSVGNGGTVLRATAHGVTGSTPVFVSQRVADVEVAPSPWTFLEIAPGVYEPRGFVARGYDALGNLMVGTAFSWATNDGVCFPIDSSTSTQATMSARCGCGRSGEISASASGVTGTAGVSTPSCGIPLPECLASSLQTKSPFRLGLFTF